MSNSIEKIIELINKTGDKCIVLDSKGNPAYVAMTFEDYEKLVLNKTDIKGLTEDQLVEKINQDVASWKANQRQEEEPDNWQSLGEVIKEVRISRQKAESSESEIEEDLSETDENSPKQAKNGETEDKYYFEPIE